MALTAEQSNFIAEVGGIAHQLIELQGSMITVNTLWFGAPDWDALITDANIQEMPGLTGAGLTNQDISDAIFVIEQIRQLVISGNLPALVLLARLR